MSQAKRQEREVRVARVRRRRWLLVVVLVALAALGVWGVRSALQSTLLEVRSVEVRGTSHLTASQVASEAAIPVGVTLLNVPVKAVEARLAANPWIASTKIERRFPHTIVISVTERRPAIVADAGAKHLWVVSQDGHWLAVRSSKEPSGGLITVRDAPGLKPQIGAAVNSPELLNAIGVVQGLSRSILETAAAVTAPSIENTAIITKTNVEIFVGSANNIAMKDRLARTILTQQKGKVVYVNVRSVDRPTWRGLNTTP